MLTDEQLKKADQLRWYHSLDFGEYQTRGRFSIDTPPNFTLFGVMDILENIDVSGMSCLDTGPAHGLISFGLALRGARVVAANIGNGCPPQFSLAEKIYGVEIDYRHGVSVELCDKEFNSGSFDLIVVAGVMYHLLNPADIFFRLRKLLKRDGLMLIETVYAPNFKDPILLVNSECDFPFPQPTTYFIPSESALHGMAKLASFEILASRTSDANRYALLVKATLPEEVSGRSDMCKKMHDLNFEDPLFNLFDLRNQIALSDIKYTGIIGAKRIDCKSFIPKFPTHPNAIKNPIGIPF